MDNALNPQMYPKNLSFKTLNLDLGSQFCFCHHFFERCGSHSVLKENMLNLVPFFIKCLFLVILRQNERRLKGLIT